MSKHIAAHTVDLVGDTSVSVALGTKLPVAAVVGVPIAAGPSVGLEWATQASGGYFRAKHHQDQHNYTVLYSLKQCRHSWHLRDEEPGPGLNG